MPTPKIKFKLIKLERALVFQVLEQDERFFCITRLLEYPAVNGMVVLCAYSPSLESSRICLRGSHTHHHLTPSTKTFSDNVSRDAYATKLLEALRDWSQNAPQFAEDKAITPTTEPDTYSF